MDAFAKFVGIVVVAIISVFGIAILMAFPVEWLVNDLFTQATLMSLFGVARITFWQALGLSVLCGILFKGSSSSSSSKD